MTKTFTKPFNVSNAAQYGEALEQLYQQISTVKKDISYLDIYNITTVCVDKSLFAAQVNALAPNSSLVINSPSFTYNDEYYETGDIILKLASGKTVHIKAQTGGVFIPNNVIDREDGNLELQYKFTTATPSEGETITLELKQSEGSGVYSYWGPATNSLLILVDSDYNWIKPYIKFYLVDENKNPVEEVVISYSIDSDSGWWYVKLDGDMKNHLYMLVK